MFSLIAHLITQYLYIICSILILLYIGVHLKYICCAYGGFASNRFNAFCKASLTFCLCSFSLTETLLFSAS